MPLPLSRSEMVVRQRVVSLRGPSEAGSPNHQYNVTKSTVSDVTRRRFVSLYGASSISKDHCGVTIAQREHPHQGEGGADHLVNT